MSQLGWEAILSEEGSVPFGLSHSPKEEYVDRQLDLSALIPLHCRVSAATVSFANEDHTTLQMTFLRKQWDREGRFTGFEQLLRNQPLTVGDP